MTSVECHSTENSSGDNHSNSGRAKEFLCEENTCAFSYFTDVCSVDSEIKLLSANRLETALSNIWNRNPSSTILCGCVKERFGEIVRGLIDILSAEDITLRRVASQCLKLLALIVSSKIIGDLCLKDLVSLVMCYGLTAASFGVQSAVCTALPHIFSKSLLDSCGFVNGALDLEPLLYCLLDLFIKTNGSKSSFKYAFVSIAKALGKEAYEIVDEIWLDSYNCGKLPSANLQLARRLTSGLFLISNDERFSERNASVSLCPKIQDSQSVSSDRMVDRKTYVSTLRYEDISSFLCRASFELVMIAVHSNVSKNETHTPSNLLFVTEELRDSATTHLSNVSGWKKIFGFPLSSDRVPSNLEVKRLMQNRRFLGLVEIITALSNNPNFNVILCSLDVAAVLLHPFVKLLGQDNSFGRRPMDDSVFKWLVMKFLSMLHNGFRDGKLVVRVASTKLALLLARLPGAPMFLIRQFADFLIPSSNSHSDHSECPGPLRPSNVSQCNRLVQESIDLTTTLLLTLPSADFNIPEVCQLVIKPGLLDEDPLVRVATLDCIAVVAHLLGPGNLGPLLEAIPRTDSGLNNSIYSGSNTAVNNSLLEAVQRRLARRQLPHLDSQCRVVRGFSTGSSAPASGSHRNGHVLRSSVLPEKQNETVTLIGLDDSTGGVFRRREHLMNDSAFYPGSASKGLRRRPSAGSVKRLPWDPQTGSAGSIASSSGVSSAASPRCLDGTQPNGISQERTLTSATPTDSHLGNFTGSQNDRETSLKPRLAKPQPNGKSETHSLPSTGRMSPAPLKATPQPFPLSMDRPLRASRGIPASVPLSNPSSGVNTPRRKPVLAPLRRSYNNKTEDQNIPWINSKTPLRSSSSLRGMSPSLLPTRATMVRQSGRSWCTLSSSPVRDQSVGRNRFGYPGSTPPSSVPQRLGLGVHDQGDSSISPHYSSRRRRKTVGLVGAATGDDDDNGASDEIYDDDYENDDDVDGNDDDDDDDDVDGDEALIYEDLSSDSGGRKHSTSLTRNRLALRYPKHATADARLDNPRVLCRSIDSELSDVTGIRSAASHRRAMRLFEDAERKRLQVDHFQSDDSDQTRRSFQEPLRVSVTEANCAVPVLDPVVVPTLPVQRSTLNKATGQRRITSGTAANGANLSGPATIVDAKTTASPRGQGHSPSVTTPGAKYNPYTGASFRENPDYSDLVIGRATGYSSSTSHVPGALLEANRTGSYQMHGLHERRPLRGQHNIQNLPISGPHSTPVTESSLLPNNIPCSPSINVVGKGLFDSTPAPSQLSPLQSSSTAVRHISPDGGLKTSRVSTSGTESVVPTQSEPGEEHQMLGASVVGVGLVEPANSAPPTEKANISTIGPEAQVSTVFRQRILQKKNKELQKLRKGATNPEPSGANTNEPVQAKSVVVKSDVSHRNFPSSSSLHELEDQTPPMYTWPPTGRSGGASSNQSNLTKSTQDNTAVTRDSPAGSKPRQPTVERPIPKTKFALEDEDETINESPSSSSETANPPSVPNKTRIASTPASRTTSLIPDSTSSSGRPIGDRPLVKGQSALNLNLNTPPLPIVLQQINSEDWEAKVSGLEALSQIALEKPNTFLGVLGQSGSASAGVTRQTSTQLLSHADTLSQAVQAIIAECRNLRSQVSRQAVQTLTSLFQGLGRAMDPHVEVCVRVLLGKTGEAAAAFLRDEVSVAMAALAQTANPSRAIGALLQHGLGHKNPAVRLQTALQIAQIVESLNTRALQSHRSSSKDARRPVGNKLNSTPAGRLSSWSSATNLQSSSSANSNASASLGALTDRLVTATSQFLTDGNQETRYHGRRLLSFLLAQPDFEKSVIKQLTGQSLRAMRDAIDQVQTRGVGELPTTSASSRRRGLSPAPSASQSRSSSANVNQKL